MAEPKDQQPMDETVTLQALERAIATLDAGSVGRSLAMLEQVSDMPPRPSLLVLRVKARYAKARFLEIAGEDGPSRLSLLKLAIADADRAVKQDAACADAHACLGAALGFRINMEGLVVATMYGRKALRELEKGLQLSTTSVWANYAMAMRELRAPSGYGGDVSGAVRRLHRCLEIEHDWGLAIVALIEAYQKLGDDEAVRRATGQLTTGPFDPEGVRSALAHFGVTASTA